MGFLEVSMREKLEERLSSLRREFEAGQRRLQELEAQAAELRQTLLRIDGAMRLLISLLQEEEAAKATDTGATEGSGAARPAPQDRGGGPSSTPEKGAT